MRLSTVILISVYSRSSAIGRPQPIVEGPLWPRFRWICVNSRSQFGCWLFKHS